MFDSEVKFRYKFDAAGHLSLRFFKATSVRCDPSELENVSQGDRPRNVLVPKLVQGVLPWWYCSFVEA